MFKKDIDEISTSSGAGGFLTKHAFGKNNIKKLLKPYKDVGYKVVNKNDIKKSKAVDYKNLIKEDDPKLRAEKFQKTRLDAFDEIENRLLDIKKYLKQGKLKTDRYYRENPDSYNVVIGTDMINDYLNDIETLLNTED